ncbi:NAD-dependent epimerase/dehydratase family protein [Parvularcula sp. ZS-1/3]|uniref:NAD-dependent epimerase/dehydratase family protein n=1 Tax=Parvularcula mediterranea TaxID=2732508 RepID=A0A7Y3W6D9_9PROT|nr:NAD-dependent epimerase/dehydratase family protein [Parvularcula mediterranea]
MRVLVSGTSGVLGHLIAEELKDRQHDVVSAARRKVAGSAQLRLDVTDEAAVRAAAQGLDAAVLCPILSVSAPAARWLAEEGVRRIVCFSSNNVGIDEESAVYRALAEAEASLESVGAEMVILRPTMIYGHVEDGNLSKLLRFAQRFGFLPCPGKGAALQQPVHISDVARVGADAIGAEHPSGAFAVSGPKALETAQLFGHVLKAAGKPSSSVLKLPLGPLKLAAAGAEAIGLNLPLKTAQLARIERDKLPTLPAPPEFEARTHLEDGLAALATELAAWGTQG